ncbi:hypothetical protein QCN29_01300 [Streptomyces sp. HNM0663]|uniref:Uncharacterized protein n=1 Tax=Streptomyces chengmaiensis TaxID=3040919 RepID=A0ABT6HFJ2_9ACTN|nr:hypothetical protein [Streptomyces chengmaiensis]MDH2387443.1 hypothetical protein [Streptomyces chengmaiensis]
MDGALSALIAVFGTVLGSTVAYLFQRKTAARNEGFAHRQQLRAERMAVYSDFAGAVTEYRRSQYDRWHRTDEDPQGPAAAEARRESYRLKGAAQHAMFRVRLIAGSTAVAEAACAALDAASGMHEASGRTRVRDSGDEAREAVEHFISVASHDVR